MDHHYYKCCCFFIVSRCCAISDTIILCVVKNVSLSSSSALLLLYDVTNKASFDNIRVRTTLGLQPRLPYLSFLLSLSCFQCMSLTTILKPLFRNHSHSFKSHLYTTTCSWTKIVTSIWNVFRTTGVKKQQQHGSECNRPQLSHESILVTSVEKLIARLGIEAGKMSSSAR